MKNETKKKNKYILENEDVQEYVEKHKNQVLKDDFNSYVQIKNQIYVKCSSCGNWELSDFMIDTTEKLSNGGVGYVCYDCINDLE